MATLASDRPAKDDSKDPEPQTKKIKMFDESKGPQCKYFVLRKKRLCKMTVKVGKDYCGEHETILNDSKEPTEDDSDKKRISCPLDPKHTVYASKLEKHLKICNARPKEDLPKYIKIGINHQPGNEDETTENKHIKLSDIDDAVILDIVNKIDDIYATYIEGTVSQVDKIEHTYLKEELDNPIYGPKTKKHLLQTSTLLELMKQLGFIQPETAFVEYGAGKGQISYYLANIIKNLPNSKVYLIDRASLRHKKDNKIDDRDLVERIRADIGDLDLSELDIGASKQLIGLSKHLCGAATDLTLRSIVNSNNATEKGPKTQGILIALCCHHRCDWNSFVGQQFLLENGITAYEFTVISKMVGWAVCGSGMSRERRQQIGDEAKLSVPNLPTLQLNVEKRKVIGDKAKRVLDFARIRYLEVNGFDCKLSYYCEQDITLENIVLVAKLNSS